MLDAYEAMKRFKDEEIEQIWKEFEDVTTIEAKDFYSDDEVYVDDISLVIASDWRDFTAGTSVEYIWHWFDREHSRGVGWLMFEFETEE